MADCCTRRTFLAGSAALIAGGTGLVGYALQPASARAAAGVVTLYMGVPEIDTSGRARPYRPRTPRPHVPLAHGPRIDWIY